VKRGSAALLGGITLLGAALRIWSPGRIGLWRDEVQALHVAALPSMSAISHFLSFHESHPPLFYFMAHGIRQLGGNMLSGMSLLVLLASVALLPAGWWLASLTGLRWAGAVAAAFLAFSVPLAFFSVQLRPYALVSLAIILGSAFLLKALQSGISKWRWLWALATLLLLYLHHLGVFVLLAQLISGIYFAVKNGASRVEVRPWLVVLTVMAIAAAPDLLLLAHQSIAVSYPVFRPMSLLQPVTQMWGVVLAFPGELALGIVGAGALLLMRPSLLEPGQPVKRAELPARFLSLAFLLVLCSLLLASYRSQFLIPHIVMAVAPLGMVAAGVAVAQSAAERRNWLCTILAEGFLVLMGLSGFSFAGNGKTNTDLIAAYVTAEQARDDLLILVPAAFGASFNYYYRGAVSQIDFPMVGRVGLYKFDNDFQRVASMKALQVTLDSMRSACLAGRRLWLVTPSSWIVGGEPPLTLTPDSAGGLGQPDFARANLLERRARQGFGPALRIVNPDSMTGGSEHLQARLFAGRTGQATLEKAASCDFS
jgi:4-amino-4-deoxy-L-arabinose transferase-like glycosyltransferase